MKRDSSGNLKGHVLGHKEQKRKVSWILLPESWRGHL